MNSLRVDLALGERRGSPPSPEHHQLVEFVHEMIDCTRIQAEIGLLYVEAGDAIGLAYVSRKMAAYMRAAIPIVKELEQARRAES